MSDEKPRYGEYAPPGWTPPEPPQPWPAPASDAAPGLIPLRPLLLADVIVAAFRLMRRNPRPTLWLALAAGLVTSLVSTALIGLVLWSTLPTLAPATVPDPATVRGIVVPILLIAVAAALVQIAVVVIPQSVVTLEVARASLGERLTLRELWSRARGRVGALLGWMLVLGGGTAIVSIAIVLALVELALTGSVGGLLAAVGLGLLALCGIVVIAFWLGTKLAFVPALIVVERLPIGAALRRSWTMTRGGFWRILGIILLVNLIVQAGAQIVMMPVTLLSGLIDPTQSAGGLDPRTVVVLVVSLLVQVVVMAVSIVVQAAVPAILYLDARMRREGFDTVLRAYASEASAGRTPSSDPFG